MKTVLIFILPVLAVLAACNNEDLPDRADTTPISFRTFVGPQTRGTAAAQGVDGSLQQNFGVFVYRNATGTAGVSAVINSLYNEEVVFAADTFGYTNAIYWPTSEKLGFYAYSPYSDGNGINGISSFVPADKVTPGILGFSFSVNANVSNQVDLLVAKTEGLQGGTVPLEFMHALSKVEVQAHTSGFNYRVAITGIEFRGVYSSGTFSYANFATPWSSPANLTNYTGVLLNNGNSKPDDSGTDAVVVTYDANANNYTAVTNPNNAMYLLPQSLPTDAELVVTYNIYNAQTGTLISATDAEQKIVQIGENSAVVSGLVEWVRNTRVIYKLNFTPQTSGPGSKVEFSATVVDWDSENGVVP